MNWFIVLLVVIFLVALTDNADAADAVVNTVTAAPITLQDSLVSIISSVQTGVAAGVNFLSAEIPDVIRQLLTWKAVQAGIWATIHLLLILLGIRAFSKAVKVINEQTRLEAEDTALDTAIEKTGKNHDDFPALRERYIVAKAAAHANTSKVVVGCILGGVLTIVAIVSFCNIWGHIMTVAQIYLAPKVWLIEYAASLVK